MKCIKQGCTNEAVIGAYCEGHVPETTIQTLTRNNDIVTKRNREKENEKDKKR